MSMQRVLSMRSLGIHDGIVRTIWDRITFEGDLVSGRLLLRWVHVDRNVKLTDEEKAEHAAIFEAMIKQSATKTDDQSGWPDDE